MKFTYGTNLKQQSGFSLIGWEQLVELTSLSFSSKAIKKYDDYQQAKSASHFITANDCPSKQLAAVKRHDNFTLLRLDLDDGELTAHDIKICLDSLGFTSYILHTSASSEQINTETGEIYGKRWRVFIQLAESLSFTDWSICQLALSIVFESDSCTNRPQQIMFLPTYYDGIKYEVHHSAGQPFRLTDEKRKSFEQLIEITQEKVVEEAKKAQVRAKPKHFEPLIDGQKSIIDAFNGSISWDILLGHYGHKPQGIRYLAPEQSTAVAAGCILTSSTSGIERYYSHSSSEQAVIGSRAIDKFDMFCIRSHNGDVSAALRALASQFPSIDKLNKRTYAKAQKE